MSYGMGVDLGATQCAAAVYLPGRAAQPRIVPLATGSQYLPSIVFANPDGSWLVGDDAQRQALRDPGRVARRFKRRIGDGTPLLVGGTPVPAEVLAARLISRVVDTVAERERGMPARVAVTHPASWGTYRVNSLRSALSAQGMDGALYLSDPEAAALAQDSRDRTAPGGAVAVYDLGGAGFEATVVRKLGPDRFTLAGRPEEIEIGGLDFDEVVFEHVRSALGSAWDELDPADNTVLTAATRLRRECTAAKEALSSDTDVLIKVALPGIDTQVRLARAEFEEMIRPAVDETVAALSRALRSAEVAPQDLAAVLLIGGSARIPLITQAVSEALGRPVSVGADPEGIVAAGAALAAGVPEPAPTRLAVWPVQAQVPVPVPAPTQVSPLDPASDPLLRSLPSFGPPPVAKPAGLLSRLPRTVAIGGAAAVLTAVAVFGGIRFLTDRTGPPPADADPAAVTESSRTEEPTEPPVTTNEQRPDPTTARPKKTNTPPPRTTTKAPPKTSSSTAPTTTTTTTTTAPTTTTPASPR